MKFGIKEREKRNRGNESRFLPSNFFTGMEKGGRGGIFHFTQRTPLPPSFLNHPLPLGCLGPSVIRGVGKETKKLSGGKRGEGMSLPGLAKLPLFPALLLTWTAIA